MKTLVIFLQLATPLLLLHTGNSKNPVAEQAPATINTSDSIQFIFKREKSPAFPQPVRIKAAIVNNSGVTRYFLSYTCDGMQDFISYDTSLLRSARFMHCNASYPVKVELKPFESKEFFTHIKQLKKDAPIDLHYRLILLHKDFKIDKYEAGSGFYARIVALPVLVLKGKEQE